MMEENVREFFEPQTKIGQFRRLIGIVGGFEVTSILERTDTIDDIRSFEDPDQLILAIRKDGSEAVVYDRRIPQAEQILRSIHQKLGEAEKNGSKGQDVDRSLSAIFIPFIKSKGR